eukprot:m.181301 g.181301  ORF g.181301 m.181301 type:complete len:342 (-) comp32058_c0_seq1:128-1153(-)
MAFFIAVLSSFSCLLVGGVQIAEPNILKANPLPKLKLNSSITVSGISAGGYMAVQYHIAHSSQVTGAGVVAGGPFWCAEDNAITAQTSCMKTPDLINPQELAIFTRNAEKVFSIDHTSNLKDAKVYVFAGTKDTVVNPKVSDKLLEFYGIFTDSVGVKAVQNYSAEHSMPTYNYGNPCGYKGSPYINNCGYDAAFDLLNHVWPDVARGDTGGEDEASLYEFDQATFFADLPAAVSMAETGYVYIPQRCMLTGTLPKCRVHVVFHGCEQGSYLISDTFVRHAGYNTHAEKNSIVMLYPQTIKIVDNPHGCYDWWGYNGPDYATKLGVQIAGVAEMVAALVGV